jgi:hypothetical protein
MPWTPELEVVGLHMIAAGLQKLATRCVRDSLILRLNGITDQQRCVRPLNVLDKYG